MLGTSNRDKAFISVSVSSINKVFNFTRSAYIHTGVVAVLYRIATHVNIKCLIGVASIFSYVYYV